MTDVIDRDALLQQFRTGYQAVVDALEGVTPEELDRVPAPNEWSARQVVHHLADFEAIAYTRLCQLIAEDEPEIAVRDQDECARRLHYDRPIETSLELFRAIREACLSLLLSLEPDEWSRSGRYVRVPAYSVERWLRIYSKHPHNHARQIRLARQGLVGE